MPEQLELPLDTTSPLPGLELFDVWVRRIGSPHPATTRRWQKAGLLVVRTIGRTRFVDTVETAKRMRHGPPRKRGRPPRKKRPDPRQINIIDHLAE